MLNNWQGRQHGVVAYELDSDIGVSSKSSCVAMFTTDKYSWERYEPHYPISYGLNSTAIVL